MTENVEKIRELIHEDRHRTIDELTDTVGISYGVCQEILTEYLNMRRIAMKFVPRLLRNDQKQWFLGDALFETYFLLKSTGISSIARCSEGA
jgi:hypothetical protein